MSGVNKVIILGNVGRDPEIRSVSNGSQVATLSIATSETWRDKQSGEKKEKTEWHRIVVWNENLVNVVSKYVHKGDQIYIEGKLESRKFVDNTGTERYLTEIVIKPFNGTITLIRGPANKSSNGASNRLAEREPDEPSPSPSRAHDLDDEIPF